MTTWLGLCSYEQIMWIQIIILFYIWGSDLIIPRIKRRTKSIFDRDLFERRFLKPTKTPAWKRTEMRSNWSLFRIWYGNLKPVYKLGFYKCFLNWVSRVDVFILTPPLLVDGIYFHGENHDWFARTLTEESTKQSWSWTVIFQLPESPQNSCCF